MKIEMQKYLFIGVQNVQAEFFEAAQKLGSIEFVASSRQKMHQLPKGVEDTRMALKTLRKMAKKPQVEMPFSQGRAVVDKILVLKREVESLHEEVRMIEQEILKVHPLGYFELSDIEKMRQETGLNIAFFYMRQGRIKKSDIPSDLIFVNSENDLDYFLYMGKNPFYHQLFSELVVKKSLTELYQEKKRLQAVLHDRESALKDLTMYEEGLYDFFLEELNGVHLALATADVESYLENRLFVIEGWVPVNKQDVLQKLTAKSPVYYEAIEPNPGETIPVCLKNKGLARVGQDLVEQYDIPSFMDKDPSGWVLWAFTLFFGMIISDAGYGFIFLLAALFGWIKYPQIKGIGRRLLTLLTMLAISSIIWGVLIASYFSIVFAPSSFVNRTSMLYNLAVPKIAYHIEHQDEGYQDWIHEYPKLASVKDPLVFLEKGTQKKGERTVYTLMDEIYNSILLELSLLVGLVHISLSFLRNFYRNWAGLGWIVTMWGGFLFLAKIVGSVTLFTYVVGIPFEVATAIGQWIMYGGLVSAVILAVMQEGWKGIACLLKIIEIFADVLSYLRLYALGLASVVMAKTFNEIGIVIGGYIGGVFIILLGHSVNISLSIMAGVIHGLRLNFLEWYHHCFEGGGRKFNPLRLLTRES